MKNIVKDPEMAKIKSQKSKIALLEKNTWENSDKIPVIKTNLLITFNLCGILNNKKNIKVKMRMLDKKLGNELIIIESRKTNKGLKLNRPNKTIFGLKIK